MAQHRPAGEVPSAPAVGGMLEEGQWVGKLYSTPVVKREEQLEAYNIRQQIGEFWACSMLLEGGWVGCVFIAVV